MNNGQHTWLVIRTFNRHELDVSTFLSEKGLTCFIPMCYQEKFNSYNTRPKRVLVPVIHNYVFVENTISSDDMKTLLSECKFPVHLLSERGSKRVCEIPNREMAEFRILCEPQNEQCIVVEENAEEAELGREVEVIHGTFAGIRGRLYRKKGQYWFIKSIGGVSVKLRITRWFCKPIQQ